MGMKEEFEKGCKQGGGSFVENPDGTFQCNTRSGLVIKCDSAGGKCWIPAKLAPEVEITVGVRLEAIAGLIALPAPTMILEPMPEEAPGS